MKDKLLFLVFLSVISLVSVPTALANFYLNPSFEDDIDDDNVPDHWGIVAGSGGFWEYREDQPDAYTGNDYIVMGNGGWAVFFQHNLILKPTDTDVTIGSYIRDVDGVTYGASFKFEFYNEPVPDGASEDWKAAHAIEGFPQSIFVTTAGDGQWHFYYGTMPIPEGAVAFTPVVVTYDMKNGQEFHFDEAYGGIGTEPITGIATNPDPTDGEESVRPDLDVLTWTSPEPNNPADLIYCDLWFTNDFPEYDKYKGDPNFVLYADKIVDYQAVESVILSEVDPPVDLIMDQTYYWRVDCYEPNEQPDGLPELKVGNVWTFDTINRAPVVDAGIKHNLWLDAGSASTTLDATVTDDGLPLSANITLEWTLDSGPSAPTFDPDNTVEDPVITFNTAGTYILRLTANDSLLDGSDTVTINVFDPAYTGLVAHWKLDESIGNTASEEVDDHEGTLIGDPTWQPADGQVNGGLLLDGDGDYIEIPDSVHTTKVTWADELADEFTLSIWMKTADGNFGDDWAGLLSKGSDAWRIQRAGNADTVELVVEDTAYAVSEIGVNDGKWHHIAGVFTGDMAYIYVDGFLQGSGASFGTLGEGSAPVWIGAGFNVDWPDDDYQFNGILDEARIYEVGLPTDKVLAEYIADGGGTSCGGRYEPADINQDCYINTLDLLELLIDWMDCTDIANPDCN